MDSVCDLCSRQNSSLLIKAVMIWQGQSQQSQAASAAGDGAKDRKVESFIN
jgi:hypothetical protein